MPNKLAALLTVLSTDPVKGCPLGIAMPPNVCLRQYDKVVNLLSMTSPKLTMSSVSDWATD